MTDYYVEIWQTFPSTGVTKTMGPFSKSKASRVADGVEMNLDEEFYSVLIVSDEDE